MGWRRRWTNCAPKQIRLRRQLAEQIDALNEPRAKFAGADAHFQAKTRAAFTRGDAPPPDERTPPERRGVEVAKAEQLLWSAPKCSPITVTASSRRSARTSTTSWATCACNAKGPCQQRHEA